jgi:predicted nucleic acid-binding protein
MNNMAVLDTGFLITLVNRNRPSHQAARNYYKCFLDHSVVMLLPTVVISEFSIVQPVTDLPLRNFRVLPFNFLDAVKCAELNAHHYRLQMGNTGQRDSVKDDFKIIAQAVVQGARLLVTEDETTLCKYCERLKSDAKIEFRVVKLSGGFDEAQVNEDGQRPLLPRE